MGNRMDKDEIVYGNDCLIGFPPGKTPKHVYARFSKIGKCPEAHWYPPNDREFKLTQNPTVPCNWRYHAGPWDIYFIIYLAPVQMLLSIEDAAEYLSYFLSYDIPGVEEGHVFANDNSECDPEIGGIGGIGIVTWKLEGLKLMESLNIKTAHDIFMEMRPLEDGSKVYKFCRLQDATNIAIKYDPD